MVSTPLQKIELPIEQVKTRAFKDIRFKGNHLVPSLVYIRPDSERLSVLIGTDSQNGLLQFPVNKSQVVYGNLKSVFKADLVRDEREPQWRYQFDQNFGFGETDPVGVSREFIRSLINNLDGIEPNTLKQSCVIHIGKPAYTSLVLERRYEKRIRAIFSDLGFVHPPVLIYEPYAVYYYCRFLLRKSFVHENAPRRSRVLIVDHGGGTINTCIVEIDKKGEITKSRPHNAHAATAGGSLVDEIILRRKLMSAEFSAEVRNHLFEKSRLVFANKSDCLLKIEQAKIKCMAQADRVARITATLNLGVPGAPPSWVIEVGRKDVEDAFEYIWNQHCRTTLAATLGTDTSQHIDYVILAGGSCRLKLHKKYLERDFGEFFRGGRTEFLDIGAAEKPVVYGLCFQAYLERVKREITAGSDITSLQNENLIEFVGRDLVARLIQQDPNEKLEPVAEAVLFRSGTPKEEIWGRDHEIGLKLRRKLRRKFAFSITSKDEFLPELIDSSDVRVIHIKQRMLDKTEKHIKLRAVVNDDGSCQPKFYLAPHAEPGYYEPDKQYFRIHIPDLMHSVAESHPPTNQEESFVLGFDFGTSVSCVSSLNIAATDRVVRMRQPFITDVGIVEHAREYMTTPLEEEEITGDRDDRAILDRLHKLDPNIAASFSQFLSDLKSPRMSYKGTACELRAVIELVLERLAPENEVQKKYKVDPKLGKVTYANRAKYVLEQKRSKDAEELKKCGESVTIIEESVASILRGVHKRTSTVVHTVSKHELEELLHIQKYFRAIMLDLL